MIEPPVATSQTTLRVSDQDRERAAERLREHAEQGRLTIAELEERLDQAYAARTQGELDALSHDLPEPAEAIAEHPTATPARGGCGRAGLRPFVAVNVLLIAIWALTGAEYFWPIWPLLGWGVAIAAKRVRTRRDRPAAAREAGIHRVA